MRRGGRGGGREKRGGGRREGRDDRQEEGEGGGGKAGRDKKRDLFSFLPPFLPEGEGERERGRERCQSYRALPAGWRAVCGSSTAEEGADEVGGCWFAAAATLRGRSAPMDGGGLSGTSRSRLAATARRVKPWRHRSKQVQRERGRRVPMGRPRVWPSLPAGMPVASR